LTGQLDWTAIANYIVSHPHPALHDAVVSSALEKHHANRCYPISGSSAWVIHLFCYVL